MALDDYDPSTALTAYYPTRAERRPARLWATEKLLHDMAELGMVEFFEGPGSDPTGISGYAIDKLWLRVSSGVTPAPGEIRKFDGSGDPSLLASWPELTASMFVALAGASADGVALVSAANFAAMRDLLDVPEASDAVLRVADYTELKALPTTGAVIVTDPTKGGTFVWRAGDYSALVTADTAEGNYVASNADPTGAAGCWVRLAPGAGRIDALSSRVSIDLAAWGMSVTASASANTAAFTAAMAYLASRNGGKATFPAGALNVNTLTIGTSDIDVVGHGAGTWLINNTTNAPAVHIDGAINNSTLRDVRIGQSASVSPTTGNCGVRAEDCFNARIESVFCIPFPAALHKGFIFDNTDEIRISDLWASSCVDIGFDFTNGCSGFSGHTLKSFSNGGAGFRFVGVSGFWVNSLHAYGNDTNAFLFSDPGGGGVNQFFFCSGWIGDTSANTNWLIANLNRSSFSNCWASTQKSAAVNTSASGVAISGSLCFDIDLIGMQVVFNNAQGLLITNGATDIRVHGGTYGAASSTGHGNGRAGSGSGIRIEAVTDIIVSGVRARGNATNGLLATNAASDYLLIRGNNFRGNTGSSLVNSSTGSNNNVGENIT